MDLSGSWDYIEWIAAERLRNNKTSHHVSAYGPEIEITGAAGELAARRFLALDEILHTHFDHGTDILYGGRHIDVKATLLTPRIGSRFLQWAEWKPVRAQIIVMTAVNAKRRTAVVIGYATRAEILRAPINPLRAYPCHEISVRELHPASELLTLSHRAPKALAYHRHLSQT